MVHFTREFIESLDREEIEEARNMNPARKMELAGILFDDVIQRMTDGIRHQFPHADDAQVNAILKQRLEISRNAEAGD